MKKAVLILLIIGSLTSLSFTILQGGNDPVEGIDVIIRRRPVPKPIHNFSMDNKSLKELSALADVERSVYLSKYLTPIFEKLTKEKGLEKVILKGLLENRCIKCKSFESITFKVPSINKEKGYSITLNIKFDTKWITVITDRDNFKKPIANPHNFELIDIVNELESKIKPENRKELVQQFKKTNFSKLKTKNEVFKTYIRYLEKSEYKRISERLRHKNRATLKEDVKTIERKKQ